MTRETFIETPALQRCAFGLCVALSCGDGTPTAGVAPTVSPVWQGLLLPAAGCSGSPAESPRPVIKNTVPT